MKNKRTRIFSAFSMVEMMLLLVIVSLMLASGVTVISKKHVKVPRIASHGAYICYVNTDGNIHEEKYLGIGLTNKVLDQDTAQCVFVPPQRASYFYIQATGGGGGGGESGYEGGNLLTYESETEVISPFHITENLLTLKGMSLNELQSYGGVLWAYANGAGDYGDGGKGGDLYYIQQDCANGACLVYREWEYTGTQEKECDCDTDYKCGTAVTYSYTYPCTKTSSSSSTCSSHESDTDYTCYSYKKNYDSLSYGEEIPEGGTCSNRSTKYCHSKSACEDLGFTDGRTYGSVTYCSRYYITDYDTCTSCSWQETCDGSCINVYDLPIAADCAKSGYTDLTVQTVDTKAEDIGANPPYRIQTSDPQLIDDGSDIEERILLRDRGNNITICNYGNTSIYTGVKDGIFGSFSSEDGVNVDCDTKALRAAFGEQMMYLSSGETSVQRTETLNASTVYDVEITDEERFPMYLLTEEYGLDSAFGTSCKNTYNGDCKTSQSNNSSFTNPMTGTVYKTVQNLPTTCSITRSTWTTQDGTQGCNSLPSGASTPKESSRTSSGCKTINISCSCVRNNSSGSECLYDYNDVTDEEKECMYIPAVASGGTKGVGKQCTLNNVGAGLEIAYVGTSSIIAGIPGSDYLCTGAGYQALYTKAEWQNQPSCYAENGTESQGSARIELGGNWCAIHEDAVPGKGQGAYKETTGGTGAIEGEGAPYDSSGNAAAIGSINGSGYTEDSSKICGSNHVGYCLKASGNNTNIRENGKYTYKYTWNTNYLQYGNGGEAGEYRVKIIRSFKNKDVEITLGMGGSAGECDGSDGGDTIVGDILTAKGGAGGTGCHVTVTEQLPYWYSGGSFEAVQAGGEGGSVSISYYKTNILNLVLPVDNSILGQWIAASGAGGNGGGSYNDCWASEWERWFEGKQLEEATGGKLDAAQLESEGCRKGTYWGTIAATDGTAGAVLIRW